MEKKTPRRKLIGFLAGEKGSIGKLQALGLGIAGIISGGLLVPHEVKGFAEIDGWNDGTWDYNTYYDSQWGNADGHDPDVGPYWDFAYGPNPGPGDGGGGGWDNGYNDWSGNWINSPPTVQIEVK